MHRKIPVRVCFQEPEIRSPVLRQAYSKNLWAALPDSVHLQVCYNILAEEGRAFTDKIWLTKPNLEGH